MLVNFFLFEGFGLGFWNEQSFKAVHEDFKTLWEDCNYQRDMDHPDYDNQLNKCVNAVLRRC